MKILKLPKVPAWRKSWYFSDIRSIGIQTQFELLHWSTKCLVVFSINPLNRLQILGRLLKSYAFFLVLLMNSLVTSPSLNSISASLLFGPSNVFQFTSILLSTTLEFFFLQLFISRTITNAKSKSSPQIINNRPARCYFNVSKCWLWYLLQLLVKNNPQNVKSSPARR